MSLEKDGSRNGSEHNSIETEEKTLSTIPHDGPPNGGLTAWLQVAGAFFIFFNTWGVINTYGDYQTFYQEDFLRSESASNISWVGSMQAALLFIVGAATGPIYDAGYLRQLLVVGTFMTVFGMMMTSVCKTYWQVFLAQGITVGIGNGCLFLSSVVIVSQYFTTKKAIATGIASVGSSLGGMIYPIVFHQLQPRIGFGWATRVIAFIMLATSVVSIASMKQRVPAPARRDLFDLAAIKDIPYILFNLGVFFGFMGIYVVFFYVQLYALQVCHTDTNLTFYLLSIINAASFFGRIIPNFFADKIGPLNIQIPFTWVATLLVFCWIAIQSTSGLIVFCIFYGFFSGTFVSLPGPTVVSLSPDLAKLGTRMGMTFVFTGFGLLIGTPVAGAILWNRNSWIGLQAWCGTSLALSGACMVAARLAKIGPRIRAKA